VRKISYQEVETKVAAKCFFVETMKQFFFFKSYLVEIFYEIRNAFIVWVLRSGFLGPITDPQLLKAVSPDTDYRVYSKISIYHAALVIKLYLTTMYIKYYI